MPSQILCTLEGVQVFQDQPKPEDPGQGSRGRVWAIGDADICSDGANGQTLDKAGRPIFSYAPGDKGVDFLKNAGYPGGNFHDILVCDDAGKPFVSGGGFLSKTAYFRDGKGRYDPDKYLDAAGLPYFVIEDFIRRKCAGIGLGSLGRITNLANGKKTWAVVGEIGPLYKFGELSIKAADLVGIPSDPKRGGTEKKNVLYEFWPGVPAVVNGETFRLLPRAA